MRRPGTWILTIFTVSSILLIFLGLLYQRVKKLGLFSSSAGIRKATDGDKFFKSGTSLLVFLTRLFLLKAKTGPILGRRYIHSQRPLSIPETPRTLRKITSFVEPQIPLRVSKYPPLKPTLL